jgi:hypothetical protein
MTNQNENMNDCLHFSYICKLTACTVSYTQVQVKVQVQVGMTVHLAILYCSSLGRQ